MKKTTGTLVISLDFELMWGMFDKVTPEVYDKNLEGVHTVVPEILDRFAKHDIHATWATVGLLLAKDRKTLAEYIPPTKPNYQDSAFSTYNYLQQQDNLPAKHHFAPTLIKQILNTAGQELASHTFSHYYCQEMVTNQQGESIEAGSDAAFASDVTAMNTIAQSYGATLSSIVFPRNQWTPDALRTLKSHGIIAFRGTENHFLYAPRTEDKQTNLLIRALRLLDHYYDISGQHTYHLESVNKANDTGVINIPASRFLRPYNAKLKLLEPLRLRRIKRAMTRAAKRGEIFHLWWHPHNFGAEPEENLKNLDSLIAHFNQLREKYHMESRNMHELAVSYQTTVDKKTD